MRAVIVTKMGSANALHSPNCSLDKQRRVANLDLGRDGDDDRSK